MTLDNLCQKQEGFHSIYNSSGCIMQTPNGSLTFFIIMLSSFSSKTTIYILFSKIKKITYLLCGGCGLCYITLDLTIPEVSFTNLIINDACQRQKSPRTENTYFLHLIRITIWASRLLRWNNSLLKFLLNFPYMLINSNKQKHTERPNPEQSGDGKPQFYCGY